MRLIVGLGNPGPAYAGTPHNLGFDVADILAREAGLSFRPVRSLDGLLAEGALAGHNTALLKPTTYMNLSGECVARYFRYHPLEQADLLVIGDDINLPLGRLRFRADGGPGGHKGLLSVIERLGSDTFPRLRLGVRPLNRPIMDQVKFVLSPFHPDDRPAVDEMRARAADAVVCWIRDGLSRAAGLFNRIPETEGGEEEPEKKG